MNMISVTSNNYRVALHLFADAPDVFKKYRGYLVVYSVYSVFRTENYVYINS